MSSSLAKLLIEKYSLAIYTVTIIIKVYKERKEGGDMHKRELTAILKEFECDMRNIFKDDFCMVRLYGSYARGDYNQNSDIDVMVLVNTPMNKINTFYDQVSDCAFEYLMKYKVDISPVIKNIDHFNYWKNDLPYYYNVEQEGVIVNG